MIATKEEIKVLLTDMKWESSKEPRTPSLGNAAKCICVGAHQSVLRGLPWADGNVPLKGGFWGSLSGLGSLPGLSPVLLDLPLNFKMATNTSSRIFENMATNCFHVLRNNLLLTLSVLRLLVAHRRHLWVESGTTGCSPSGMGFWELGWANFFILE